MKIRQLSFLIGISLYSQTIFANCNSLIENLSNWIKQTNSRYEFRVGAVMSSVKENAKYVGYTEGTFNQADSSGISSSYGFTSTFSDRKYARDCQPGTICLNNQGFDVKKADQLDLKIQSNNVLKIVLKSWGNATYYVPVQCSNDFMFGTLTEGTSKSFISLSFNKSQVRIPW